MPRRARSPEPTGPGQVMTVAQVAEYLQLNRLTVYRYIREGRLPAARLGRLYRILRGDVDRFLEARQADRGSQKPAAARNERLQDAPSPSTPAVTIPTRVEPAASLGAARRPRPEEIWVGPHLHERREPWDPTTVPDSPVNWILRVLH